MKTNPKSLEFMRRIFIFLFALFCLSAYAKQEQIVLTPKGQIPNREGQPLTYDMPLVYYYYDNKTQEIIIDGSGVVSYYDVEISLPVTNTVEISTQVDGTYDTFDISSLPAGSHVITIESPSGNIYEGTFTTY